MLWSPSSTLVSFSKGLKRALKNVIVATIQASDREGFPLSLTIPLESTGSIFVEELMLEAKSRSKPSDVIVGTCNVY